MKMVGGWGLKKVQGREEKSLEVNLTAKTVFHARSGFSFHLPPQPKYGEGRVGRVESVTMQRRRGVKSALMQRVCFLSAN